MTALARCTRIQPINPPYINREPKPRTSSSNSPSAIPRSTLHPPPSTPRHPPPYTLDPPPRGTLHPTPSTLNPEPCDLEQLQRQVRARADESWQHIPDQGRAHLHVAFRGRLEVLKRLPGVEAMFSASAYFQNVKQFREGL